MIGTFANSFISVNLGDLLTANSGSGGIDGVSALVNTTSSGAGTASYTGPTNFAAGSAPSSIVRADLGTDLPQSVVTANSGSSGSNGVSVLPPGGFSYGNALTSPACFSDAGGTTPTTQTTQSTTAHNTTTRVDIPNAHDYLTRVLATGPGGQVVSDQTTSNPPGSPEVSQLFDSAQAQLRQAFGEQVSISGPKLDESNTSTGPAINVGDFWDAGFSAVTTTNSTAFGPDAILAGRNQSESVFIPPGCENKNANQHQERFVNSLAQATTTDSATYRLTATAVATPPSQPPATALPDTTAKKVKRKTKKRRATFSFTGTEAPTRFECVLVKRKKGHHQHKPKPDFAPCSSPKIYKHLKRGKYTFMVRAVNAAGTDPTPATQKFKVRRTKRSQH